MITIADVSTKSIEGRMLIVAVGRLMTHPKYSNRTPDEILFDLDQAQQDVYEKYYPEEVKDVTRK